MYAREIEGQALTFGVSGKLIRNALVMYDHQTDSLWSQFLGQSVKGEFAGTKLEFIPAILTDWATWSELHPDTKALDTRGELVFDPYLEYYASGQQGVLGETVKDDRLLPKELVIGLEQDGEALAFPYRLVDETHVVNSTFQGMPVVVAIDLKSGSAVVFSRVVKGRMLSFDRLESQPPELMVDQVAASQWNMITGEAVDGPFAGAQLERLRFQLTFWFAWKDFYPHTEVYGQ